MYVDFSMAFCLQEILVISRKQEDLGPEDGSCLEYTIDLYKPADFIMEGQPGVVQEIDSFVVNFAVTYSFQLLGSWLWLLSAAWSVAGSLACCPAFWSDATAT